MNEKDREELRLQNVVLQKEHSRAWLSYSRKHRREIPLYPGSAIRTAHIAQMRKFISDEGIEIDF